MPVSVRQHEIIAQKLEFYLHIYFAIFPVHPMNQAAPNGKELKKELHAFKVFLDTKGAELSKTSEFLPFYALPYVTNPLEHPTFRNLFSKKWAFELRSRVKTFLQANLPKISSPQLFQWYAAAAAKKRGPRDAMAGPAVSAEVEEYKERMLMMQKHLIVLQKKEEYAKTTLIESQSKWTNFSKEILSIAKELYMTLEQLGVAKTVSNINMLPIRDKMARYDAFLNNNVEELQTKHGI